MPDTLQFMTTEVSSLTDDEIVAVWLRRNRGVCVQISRELEVSREFVRKVLYGLPGGKSSNYRIEKALIEAGAPFVADRIAEVA